MLGDHVTEFAGKNVETFDPTKGLQNPTKHAYVVRVSYEDKETFMQKLQPLADNPRAAQLDSLVIGTWSQEMFDASSQVVVEALVAVKDKLIGLKNLFIGDIISEESEISWLSQTDIGPVLMAYPNLEYLQIRGGAGLAFRSARHDALKKIVVQSGGLDKQPIIDLYTNWFPNLEYLELWLGSEDYGADFTMNDIRPLMFAGRFPNLTYLGLCNSELQNEIAQTIVESPVLNQLKELDLSKGVLTDKGATYLLNCPAINNLTRLDVSENYLSDEMITQLKQLTCEVVTWGQKEEDDDDYDDDDDDFYRYVTVGE